MNKPITSALIALGLVSAGSVAHADSTVTINGTSYYEVFITGSTAARANVFDAISAASGGVFDSAPTFITDSGAYPGAAPTGSSNEYTAYGTIGGVNYCICAAWTGSEAGLFAIQHFSGGLANPILASTLGGNPAYPNAVIPGTPEPTTFVNPNTGADFSAAPDLSMADTSQAVSLSATPALHDYGIVGAVTFEWVKGYNSTPDSSWNDITNVTEMQMNNLLAGPVNASYLTGNTADSDLVFAVGRNRASGTHQNTMIDTLHGTTTPVDQWVANDATYSSSGVLTIGAVESLSTAGGIDEVFNDGYDSGGNVAKTLECDEAGSQNVISQGSVEATTPLVMIGYLGISDATTAIGGGAKALTLDGMTESDALVEQGTYSFWGHEHLYGEVTEDSQVEAVAQKLAGTTVVTAFGQTPTGSALQNAGGLGGGEANPGSTQSSIISPEYMNADKPGGSDSGYPTQL